MKILGLILLMLLTGCTQAQPEKANIPIIAMSANAFEEDKKKAFDVKMNDYITKPIDFQKMEVVLKHVLSKKDPLS